MPIVASVVSLLKNVIQPFVIVYKVSLFLVTTAVALIGATHYSLIETTNANELEPYEYLKQVLMALLYVEVVEEIKV